MSGCETCIRPGACCSGFVLSFRYQTTGLEMLAELAKQWMPFAPLYRAPDRDWKWWCPLLGADGWCTDYDNRPYTCREFEPGSDPLCVHHVEPKGCLDMLNGAAA